eukprot:2206449-Amphidinium_carterae.2
MQGLPCEKSTRKIKRPVPLCLRMHTFWTAPQTQNCPGPRAAHSCDVVEGRPTNCAAHIESSRNVRD